MRQQRLQGVKTLLDQRAAQQAAQTRVTERLQDIAERKRREGVQQQSALELEGRKAERAAETATIAFERQQELARLKADLKKTGVDPLGKRKKQLEISKLEKELAKEPRLSAAEQTLEIKKQSTIFNPEANWNLRKSLAQETNADPEAANYYFVSDPVETGWLDFARDKEGEITPIRKDQLPIDPNTGRQVTPQDVYETAKANNMSLDEVLQAIGAL